MRNDDMTMRDWHKNYRRLFPTAVLVTALLWLSGCVMVGPDSGAGHRLLVHFLPLVLRSV